MEELEVLSGESMNTDYDYCRIGWAILENTSDPRPIGQAISAFVKAIEKNKTNFYFLCDIARIYRYRISLSKGTLTNHQKAEQLLLLGVKYDNASAETDLGSFYFSEKQNEELAQKYLTSALRKGYFGALLYLKELKTETANAERYKKEYEILDDACCEDKSKRLELYKKALKMLQDETDTALFAQLILDVQNQISQLERELGAPAK